MALLPFLRLHSRAMIIHFPHLQNLGPAQGETCSGVIAMPFRPVLRWQLLLRVNQSINHYAEPAMLLPSAQGI
jgi:hypothetical protein